jgi:hypothetical protein
MCKSIQQERKVNNAVFRAEIPPYRELLLLIQMLLSIAQVSELIAIRQKTHQLIKIITY